METAYLMICSNFFFFFPSNSLPASEIIEDIGLFWEINFSSESKLKSNDRLEISQGRSKAFTIKPLSEEYSWVDWHRKKIIQEKTNNKNRLL